MKYDPVYDQVSAPNAGARVMPGKDRGCEDALGKGTKALAKQNQTKFDATVNDTLARTQTNKQIGETAIPVKTSKHISEQEV